MAFSNLFSKLSDVCVRRPSQPPCTFRNDTGDVQRDRGRKRNSDRPGPCIKRQYQQAQATRRYFGTFFPNEGSKPVKVQGDYEHASGGVIKGTTASKHAKKERHQEGQRRGDRHQIRNARKHDGGSKNRNHAQVVKVQHFTPEFKEQNALDFDGQIICRHFLFGKCIKGDGCQMKHVEPANDIIKQHCKFYVQGCCIQGKSCPFMHKSFPCKFFHHRGCCSRGEDCLFSHEPLNDLTAKLLDEVINVDNELAKKTVQTPWVQPATTDELEATQVVDPADTATTQANNASDQSMQPFRFNFYNSAESNAGKEKLCLTEDATVAEEDAQPHEPSVPVPDSPLHNPHPVAPVGYSVEVLLGPQLYNPLSSAFQTPPSQDGSPLSAPPAPWDGSGSGNPSKIPYSVEAVLRASTSQHDSALHRMPNVTGVLPAKNCANKVLEKTLKKTLAQQDVGYDNQEPASSCEASLAGYMTACPKTAPHLPANMASSMDRDQSLESNKDVFRSLFLSPPSVVSIPKARTPLTPHGSHLPNNSQDSVQPFNPFSEQSTRLKDKAPFTASTEGRDSVKQKSTQSETLLEYYSAGITDSLDSVPGCAQTSKTHFKCQFASNITSTSTDPVSPRRLAQSNCAPPESAKYQHLPDERTTCAGSLRNLFATPLSELGAPLPCLLSQPHHSMSSATPQESWQPSSNAPFMSDGAPSSVTEASHKTTPTANEDERLLGVVIEVPAQRRSQAETLSSPRASVTRQQLGIMPAHVGKNALTMNARVSSEMTFLHHADCSTAATSKSVLKTLFLSLSPFTKDGR
ncbi:uncharacterized protein LOC129183337 isoform X2 [Dunckerocampus dactyliophorus]|uniref:uncharacterized protein LOC129183337 isoform X2 n=1 Tax=Dunckerocampus dactyliophorus TaxID=161453 RepID=UPI002406DC5C|nr:uncharacterized protein LOC129183337 isoform X2 [Dunckerocampus dactyliophorus]